MSRTKAFLEIDPSIDVSHSGNPASLAYSTARTRWPKIIAGAVANVEEVLTERGLEPAKVSDGAEVVKDLKVLLTDLESDAQLTRIPDDGKPDIQDFNQELDHLGPITWHNAPWLFNECYMYRRIQTCFSMRGTSFWKSYDVFAKQKRSALMSSKVAIVELVSWYLALDLKSRKHEFSENETLKALMEEMVQVSLWGNATDLLLLISISVEELHSRQGKKSRESFKHNIVDDDFEQLWDLLSPMPSSEKKDREVHIVLDNAGFEFVTDLVFAEYLLVAGCATKVVLHGKNIPWFVSDVTDQDLDFTLRTLTFDAASLPNISEEETHCLEKFGTELYEWRTKGQLQYEADPFWTTQHSHARMSEIAPGLFKTLSTAELVIFKGDLNYRKLVFDGLWPHDTPFQRALGRLGTPSVEAEKEGLRILALRTCKADTCVGLAPGREAEVDPDGTSEWTRNGKYAVISFFDAKGKSLGKS